MRAADTSGSDAVADTLATLRVLLMDAYPASPRPWDAALDPFVAWRLDAALSSRFTTPHPNASDGPSADAAGANGSAHTPLPDGDGAAPRFRSAPPLHRGRMVPDPIERRIFRRLMLRLRGKRSHGPGTTDRAKLRERRRLLPWTRVATRRRALLAFFVFLPSVVASGFMVNVLPRQGGTWLEVAIVVFFGALFSWISIGFWTALFGFLILARGRERFAITNLDAAVERPLDGGARTAIVMPICAEPVERVFAGLRAIHASLARVGALEYFHFFVLSDTADPDVAMREEAAWFRWCREVDGFARIFYRRRRVRLRRKSGNVADFCRRWGHDYRYMVMLDADSVMAGETLVRMVRMMEARPDVGVIQTAPAAVNRCSLFARVQQFGSRVYGPMFAAGLHYWQLGDGQYWGHNAIIRVAPFMAHCALPRLPGKPPLGGEILSHDFVEAALMGRAGWTLWLAYDLGGSYEEVPSTLLEEMKRDRRWCQGNLQHLRLLFTEGLFGAHRALFLNGVLSYVSALLWFTFLTLSTAEVIQNALREPNYFPSGPSLFPAWPIWRPNWARALLAVTGMILFLPKLLSVALIVVKRREARLYGGFGKLALSMLVEILISSLLAPIRMVFHSRFVLLNLLGRTVTWRSQEREDSETGWGEAIRHHGVDTVVACLWGGSLFWLNPDYFWWVMPIIGALIVSIPLSVYASHVRLGARARAAGLFLIPEEIAPPRELRDVEELTEVAERAAAESGPALVIGAHDHATSAAPSGFVRAVVDPGQSAVHCALQGAPRSARASILARREALTTRVLVEGPGALTVGERDVLLRDPQRVDELHRRVWVAAEPAERR
ncbi:MAG: glucans biosynthesis glucosyltransferase MdoH [Deltaproteobacteria bacterium]|nr:glucans biosynthesis glucosyltransferase MdoH [Deltaproteobacteria bacterium]